MKIHAVIFLVFGVLIYSQQAYAFNYFYNESLSSTFSSSTTLADKMTLEFTPPYRANYTIIAYAEVNSSNLGNSINISFTIDGGLFQNITYKQKDLNDSYPYPFLKRIELSPVKHNLSLQFATNQTANSVAMKNARIFVFDGEVEYSENEEKQSKSFSTESLRGQLNFTPTTTGDYLIITTAFVSVNDVALAPQTFLYTNAGFHANAVSYLDDKDTNDTAFFGAIQNVSLTNTLQSINITLTGSDAAGVVAYIKDIHIAAVRLSQFKTSFYNETNIEAGTLVRGTFQSNLTLDYTPNAAAYCIIGSTRSRGSAVADILYQFNNGTVNLTEAKIELTNAAQRDFAFFFSVFNMTNNFRSDRVEHTTPNGGTPANFALNYTRLTALELRPAAILQAVLDNASSGSSTSISQNNTFIVIANLTCLNGGCAHVNATLRYNATGANPDTAVAAAASTAPFFTLEANPRTCPNSPLKSDTFCQINWTVNVTSPNQTASYYFDINFTSEDLTITSNDTLNFQINISDTTKPTVTLNAPSNASTKNSELILFNCSVTDSSSISNVSLWGNWSRIWHRAANTTTATAGNYIFNFNISSDFQNQTDQLSLTSLYGFSNPQDITTINGSEFWIVDSNVDAVIHVNRTGGIIANYSITQTSNGRGITTNGSEFWITDVQGTSFFTVFHYNSTFAYIDNFSTSAFGSQNPNGITTINGSEFWIVDGANDTVYRVNRTGGLIAKYFNDTNNPVWHGIDTIDGSEFWLLDMLSAAGSPPRHIIHTNNTFGTIEIINVSQYFTGTGAGGGITTTNGLDFWFVNVLNDHMIHVAATKNGSYVWNCEACDSFNNCNFAQNNNTLSVQAPQDLSFTVFIPADNATGLDTSSASATDSIVFNTTNTNGKKTNATALGGAGSTQTNSVSIFRYLNTGTQSLNITMSFGSSPTCTGGTVTVKAANADAGYESSCSGTVGSSTCANIATSSVIVASNLGISQTKDVWLWADYSGCGVNLDQTQTLTHASGVV